MPRKLEAVPAPIATSLLYMSDITFRGNTCSKWTFGCANMNLKSAQCRQTPNKMGTKDNFHKKQNPEGSACKCDASHQMLSLFSQLKPICFLLQWRKFILEFQRQIKSYKIRLRFTFTFSGISQYHPQTLTCRSSTIKLFAIAGLTKLL